MARGRNRKLERISSSSWYLLSAWRQNAANHRNGIKTGMERVQSWPVLLLWNVYSMVPSNTIKKYHILQVGPIYDLCWYHGYHRQVSCVNERSFLATWRDDEVGLIVNKGKSKHMVESNTQNCSQPRAIEIGRRNFERVDNFIYKYLGSLMTGDNNVSEEISDHLIAANRTYFKLESQFKSELLSRKIQILMYKTLVRPLF